VGGMVDHDCAHQKQKDLYNLLQYTVFYGLSGIQPGF
jgi:hypothetical protein